MALNHTAGLSLPQQVMMSLFGLVEMMDTEKVYQKACMEICERRFRKLITRAWGSRSPMSGRTSTATTASSISSTTLRKHVGNDVVEWLKENVHPLDIPFKLAQDHGIVLLNGSGFEAPNWSARVSFANLDDDAYEAIGRARAGRGARLRPGFPCRKRRSGAAVGKVSVGGRATTVVERTSLMHGPLNTSPRLTTETRRIGHTERNALRA